ncbi:condensation domain protein [Mycobacterium xenopi 4042]|uniref:Condensation domain protein n=1 Tax=Mycobacterium xenopi 4042 TaxID=1299334 RepID=X8DD68_MYCXE|nr:condensation domain protein [Mycobacterium xenopi 4042]
MIPAAVVALAAMPLTVNGKLDNGPCPHPNTPSAPIAPRQRRRGDPGRHLRPSARTRAGRGRRLLLRPRRRQHLGDAADRRRQHRSGCGLTVRAVFETPTVAGLASRIGGTRPAPAVGTGGAAGGVPLSFAQQRLWVLDQLQGPSPVYNMAAALQLRGPLDAEALAQALADVVGATRACARNSCGRGHTQQLVVPPSMPISAGRFSMPPNGRRAGSAMPSTPRRVTRSTWPPRFLCGQGFSASLTTTTCWWWSCTTLPPTAGRSPHWCVTWERPTPVGVPDRYPTGRSCRCNTPTTPCGSARSWVSWPTPTAHRRATRLLGAGPGRDARAAATAHRPALPAGCRSPRRQRRGGMAGRDAAADYEGGPRAQRDQLHGDRDRPRGAAVQAERQP